MGAVNVSVGLKAAQLERALRELRRLRGGAPKAVSRALNKTATGVKTDTVRAIAGAYTIKQKDIRAVLKVRKSSVGRLRSSVAGYYKPISLIHFKVRPSRVTNPRPLAGLSVSVKKGSAKRLPHAFIAVLGGSTAVVERKGKSRFPLKKLYGPSVSQMMGNAALASGVMKLADVRLAKNLDQQISYLSK